MLPLGYALGIWGGIITLITVLGKALKKPLIESFFVGLLVAMLSLAFFLHPFCVDNNEYIPQYGDSVVAIIIAASFLLSILIGIYLCWRIGRCFCCCCKDDPKFEKIVHYDALYSDEIDH